MVQSNQNFFVPISGQIKIKTGSAGKNGGQKSRRRIKKMLNGFVSTPLPFRVGAMLFLGLILASGLVSASEASDGDLYCMNCNNCKVFELTSHSIKCESSQTQCMVSFFIGRIFGRDRFPGFDKFFFFSFPESGLEERRSGKNMRDGGKLPGR